MQCTQCGHINQSGKFCVKCGASLEAAAAAAGANPGFPQGVPQQQTAVQPPYAQPGAYAGQAQPQYGQPAQFNQPNPQLQQAKQVANQFFNLFGQALKRPMRVSEQTNAGQMASGIISLVLFALLAPLTVYFLFKSNANGESVPFGEFALRPFAFMLFIVLAANTLIFVTLKFGNVVRSYKEVLARFGAYSVPAVAIVFVAFLLSLMDANLTFDISILGIGIVAWILGIGFTVYSYKSENTGGLDAFYGALLSIAITVLLVFLLKDVLSNIYVMVFRLMLIRVIMGGSDNSSDDDSGLSGLNDLLDMLN
ncbi:hypothetical protein [Cohnella yongneupensis]|uniref:Zinc ribbon domain-containing protein n=1 Tax=Cohnella yongneupensis TaxID=425006 RepID=A0ABW0R2X0_9BACL